MLARKQPVALGVERQVVELAGLALEHDRLHQFERRLGRPRQTGDRQQDDPRPMGRVRMRFMCGLLGVTGEPGA